MAQLATQTAPSLVPPLTNTVDKKAYRDGMSYLAAAVNVITSDGPAGRCGFTASAVCSVTDSPPTLLVCLNKTSQSSDAVKLNGTICVNTISGSHEGLCMTFAGADGTKDMDARFAGGEWTTLATGAPVLVGATVAFDCRIVEITEIGSHDVLFCEVVEIEQGENSEGLVYFGRAFHKVAKL
jgi:flavin reductase